MLNASNDTYLRDALVFNIKRVHNRSQLKDYRPTEEDLKSSLVQREYKKARARCRYYALMARKAKEAKHG